MNAITGFDTAAEGAGPFAQDPLGRADFGATGDFGATLPEWNSDADEILICRQVRQETVDVATFVFSGRTPSLFRFRPGQFLTLELPIDGAIVNRSYTISASAARPYRISITVKRKAGGVVSNWLHDNLRPGVEVRAVGPLGDFTPPASSAPKWLMLSGGSGITPLMSMARTCCDLSDDRDIVFVHAARSPRDIIFRHELDMMAEQMPQMHLAYVCESISGAKSWPGFVGRLSPPMLQLIADDVLEREVFCCGPEPFMTGVRAILQSAGFDMERYHQESFDFSELSPSAEPAPALTPAEEPIPVTDTFQVEFAKSGTIVQCGPGTTILGAARAAGLRVPSSCTRGLCGTCKSRLLSGTVEMKHGGGIRQREIDQGMALLCCSKPTSDVVVDR
jgi:glycine betaine catabolism B